MEPKLLAGNDNCNYFVKTKNHRETTISIILCFLQHCLHLDPDARPTCTSLLKYEFYKKDNFAEKFATELKAKITREIADNPLLKAIESYDDRSKERRKEKKIRKVQCLPFYVNVQCLSFITIIVIAR